MTDVDAVSENLVEAVAAEPAPTRCPVDHATPRAAETDPSREPVATTTRVDGIAPSRSRPDRIVRSLLRIPERPAGVSVQSAHAAFQRSMAISALRCTLTYVVFPFLVPVVGVTAGVGPALGILIGVTAIACDVFTIRRFFAVDHRWRWQFATVVAIVAVFLTVLLVEDITRLT